MVITAEQIFIAAGYTGVSVLGVYTVGEVAKARARARASAPSTISFGGSAHISSAAQMDMQWKYRQPEYDPSIVGPGKHNMFSSSHSGGGEAPPPCNQPGGGGGSSAGPPQKPDKKNYAPRVRKRGVEDPRSHNFPYSFDDIILSVNPLLKANGYRIYQAPGHMNKMSGVFEMGVNRAGEIDHRFFRPGK